MMISKKNQEREREKKHESKKGRLNKLSSQSELSLIKLKSI